MNSKEACKLLGIDSDFDCKFEIQTQTFCFVIGHLTMGTNSKLQNVSCYLSIFSLLHFFYINEDPEDPK